jgi:chemosensory pili system protein ChpA (sensor histidine kinase/response regulator)
MSSRPPRRSVRPVSTLDASRPDSPAILVVDDDDAVRRLMLRALRTAFTVYEARDGEEAAQMLEDLPRIACLVTDVRMPKMDGLVLAKKLRQDARLRSIPIVFVTGKSAEAGGVLDLINAGVRHYIQKPFKVAELVEKVRTAVG